MRILLPRSVRQQLLKPRYCPSIIALFVCLHSRIITVYTIPLIRLSRPLFCIGEIPQSCERNCRLPILALLKQMDSPVVLRLLFVLLLEMRNDEHACRRLSDTGGKIYPYRDVLSTENQPSDLLIFREPQFTGLKFRGQLVSICVCRGGKKHACRAGWSAFAHEPARHAV